MGVASLSGQALPPVYAICMLCQEESKDVAAEDKAFVLAACVYRSSLLRKSNKPSEEENSELCLSSSLILSLMLS